MEHWNSGNDGMMEDIGIMEYLNNGINNGITE